MLDQEAKNLPHTARDHVGSVREVNLALSLSAVLGVLVLLRGITRDRVIRKAPFPLESIKERRKKKNKKCSAASGNVCKKTKKRVPCG